MCIDSDDVLQETKQGNSCEQVTVGKIQSGVWADEQIIRVKRWWGPWCMSAVRLHLFSMSGPTPQ